MMTDDVWLCGGVVRCACGTIKRVHVQENDENNNK